MEKILKQIQEIASIMRLQKEVFTIEELSLYTGYTVDYIYKLVHQGDIPFTKPPKGKKLFFIKEEIVDWISTNKSTSDKSLDERANNYLMTNKFRNL